MKRVLETLVSFVAVLFFIPFCILLFLGAVLYTPIDYIRFKRSVYQKDYPRRYKWLCGCHTDNPIYTIVKKNKLPIAYLRFYDAYELPGDFILGDTVLLFSKPFFYAKEKEAWLFLPDKDEDGEAGEENLQLDEEDNEDESLDDCLGVEDALAWLKEQYKERYPDRNCARFVFFYEEKFVKDIYGEIALQKMQEEGIFILYKKRELKKTILQFVEQR